MKIRSLLSTAARIRRHASRPKQPVLAVKAALYVALVAAAAFGHLRIVRIRPLIVLGSISYALYLLHQVIGSYIIGLLVSHGVNANLAVIGAVAIVVPLAAAVCYGIERPAQRAIRSRYAAFARRDARPPTLAAQPARP